VPDSEFEFGADFIIGHFDECQQCYKFDRRKLTKLRAHTVEAIPWCRDCFCKWHCSGDCAYKTRHVMVDGKFKGDSRCEITRALTLDQILEKIAKNGGIFWAENYPSGELNGKYRQLMQR
jgi:radical SAM protein with 4Fe4S-binding SPASM domain